MGARKPIPTINCIRLITVSKSWTEIRTPHNKKYGSAKTNRFGQFLKTVSDHRCFSTMVIQDICPTKIDHGWRRMNENGVSIMSIQIRTYTGIDPSQTSYVLLKRNKSSRIS